ncbi:metal transporter Nramp1-like isoform X2 [Punica granatum]|nr:metal transporter Nramp1-like isoform X2 [Punica granatum]XP_031385970.1 metal transporter Nramp1-like isoform X2 [Punica granatum]
MEYPPAVNYCLWALAEVAVIAADIPEVIGTAVALNMLLKVPIWAGVLLAGLNTLLLLGLQRYGIRKLEIVIVVLLLVVGGCFFAVMVHARPSAEEIVTGMFVPKLDSGRATRDAVALLGALIMPHNLYLHSALVISRKIQHSSEGIRSASRYFMLESGVALFFTFLINVAVVSVSASVCSRPQVSPQVDKSQCKDITLQSAAVLLKNALGNWSSKLFAISLLASGQSSTVTGTYAGQFIMQGFLDLKMKLWLRNLVTRCIAIAPSLVVCIIGGSAGASRLIIIASMILSFDLPFALVPLLRFTSREAKMHQHKSSITVTILSWILGFGTIGINMYFITTSLAGWITSGRLPKVLSALVATIMFPAMVAYVVMLMYLICKPEMPPPGSESLQADVASGGRRTPTRDSNSAGSDRIETVEEISTCL